MRPGTPPPHDVCAVGGSIQMINDIEERAEVRGVAGVAWASGSWKVGSFRKARHQGARQRKRSQGGGGCVRYKGVQGDGEWPRH